MLEHVAQEEGQPNAFSFAMFTNEIHTIVPITASDQRQAVLPKFEPILNRAHAMLVERAGFTAVARRVIVTFLFGPQQSALEKRYFLIQHAGIAQHLDVAAG